MKMSNSSRETLVPCALGRRSKVYSQPLYQQCDSLKYSLSDIVKVFE